jgi:choline dehydrogenase
MHPDAADFVVVGAGSAGCAVTRRLVEAGAEVALIEAGGDGRGDAALADPTRWVSLAGGPFDWGLAYAPHPATLDRVIPIPRGRVLGGSGQTNAMMWYRGHPADYDRWAALGCDGWGWADCLPAFRACETRAGGDPALRGTAGPLLAGPPADPHPLAVALIAAAGEYGLPVIDDPNGASNEGAALADFNIHAGRRWGPAEGYLDPIRRAANLTLHANTRVLRLAIAGDRVTGVVTDGGAVQARRGVVLCAGAVGTPHILMLSGVGPEDALRAQGIAVRVDAPGVGADLQDHPLVRAVNFTLRRPLPPPRDNGGGAILNWRSAGAARPDLHAFPVAGRSATPALLAHHALPDTGLAAIAPGLMGSRSRGRLRLASADPAVPPVLEPGFLTHPDDLPRLIEGVRTILDIARQPALADLIGPPVAPDDGDLETFVRRACSTFFHTSGTARMGADDAAPVTPRLRLKGLDALWIADASVIPEIPTCNTHAPVTMIGERAATFIREDA